MRIADRVYGRFDLSEPVLQALVKSPALRRLKGIDQSGYFEPHYPGTAFSRFEHSLGVCRLLELYGAPLEERVAGLIHDVSHSAFSHCIDYVLDAASGKKQSHQDDVFEEFVRRSGIPAILERHGLEVDYVLDDRNFPLKERDLPDLCADRIDYSLRTAVAFKLIRDASAFLRHLAAEDGRWVFDSVESAEGYARLFLELNTRYYSSLPSAIMFQTVGDYLRHALAESYISHADLYSTDKKVLAKLGPRMKTDARLAHLFDRMNNRIPCRNDPRRYEAKVFCKSRMVDPLCRRGLRVRKLSDFRPAWAAVVERESRPKEYFLKFGS